MKRFMAVYTASGSKGETPSQEIIAKGMAAWMAWGEKNAAAIVDGGGPLGKTKLTSPEGVSDVRNNLVGYLIVQAESHEAAARLFEGHPHFSVFPGDGVEVMEVLPIPTMP